MGDSIYILNNGDVDSERTRLEVQHSFFNVILENQLLPSHIATELAANPSPKVLEIATGTGIWLRELAKTLPESAELVGLDYDTSKFPKTVPPNMRLIFGDMYKPFPEELQGKFDVVHIRLILYAAKTGMGAWLARNVLSLLRPGGWLVWLETGDLIATVEPPSYAWFRLQQLNYKFAIQVDRDLGIPLALPHYIKEAGYTDCGEKIYPTGARHGGPQDAEILSLEQRMAKAFIKIGTSGIIASGGVDGMRTQEEADELIAKAEEELIGDSKLHALITQVWGRKPLS